MLGPAILLSDILISGTPYATTGQHDLAGGLPGRGGWPSADHAEQVSGPTPSMEEAAMWLTLCSLKHCGWEKVTSNRVQAENYYHWHTIQTPGHPVVVVEIPNEPPPQQNNHQKAAQTRTVP